MISVGMLTAPRAKVTLHRSIDSFRRAGFQEEVTLFAEPGAAVSGIDGSIHVEHNLKRLGNTENFKRALSTLLKRTDTPWVMVLEDDVVWAPNSADVLRAACANYSPMTTGFLTPYTSEQNLLHRGPPRGDGWQQLSFRRPFWGALALCFSRSAAEDFFQCLAHAPIPAAGADSLVGKAFVPWKVGRPCYTHVPSLCDHIGETSSITPELDHSRTEVTMRYRRGFQFRGEQ